MKGEILSEEWGGNRSHGPSPELGARLPASAPAEVWAATQTGADHIHICLFFNFMSLLVLRLWFLGQVGERRVGQPHSSVPAEGKPWQKLVISGRQDPHSTVTGLARRLEQ